MENPLSRGGHTHPSLLFWTVRCADRLAIQNPPVANQPPGLEVLTLRQSIPHARGQAEIQADARGLQFLRLRHGTRRPPAPTMHRSRQPNAQTTEAKRSDSLVVRSDSGPPKHGEVIRLASKHDSPEVEKEQRAQDEEELHSCCPWRCSSSRSLVIPRT